MGTLSIPLTQGKLALIDEEDYPLIAGRRWYAARPKPAHANRRTWYAQTTIVKPDGRKTTILMHRVILGLRHGEFGDHKNGDGLDNRRENLRRATRSQNGANRPQEDRNKSGWKGVSLVRKTGRWHACIKVDGKTLHIGTFPTAEEAAHAHDRAARKHFDEFALTNFPEESTR